MSILIDLNSFILLSVLKFLIRISINSLKLRRTHYLDLPEFNEINLPIRVIFEFIFNYP